MSVRVEPMVSVGQATAFLVPRGYTLAVCLEVAEATLGGLAMGVGMTTYSHKVTRFKVLLSDDPFLYYTYFLFSCMQVEAISSSSGGGRGSGNIAECSVTFC